MASKSIDWDELLLTNDPKKKEIEVSFKKIDGEGLLVSKGNEPGTPPVTEGPDGSQPDLDPEGDFPTIDPDNPPDGGPIPGESPECAGHECASYSDFLVSNSSNILRLSAFATVEGVANATGWNIATTGPDAGVEGRFAIGGDVISNNGTVIRTLAHLNTFDGATDYTNHVSTDAGGTDRTTFAYARAYTDNDGLGGCDYGTIYGAQFGTVQSNYNATPSGRTEWYSNRGEQAYWAAYGVNPTTPVVTQLFDYVFPYNEILLVEPWEHAEYLTHALANGAPGAINFGGMSKVPTEGELKFLGCNGGKWTANVVSGNNVGRRESLWFGEVYCTLDYENETMTLETFQIDPDSIYNPTRTITKTLSVPRERMTDCWVKTRTTVTIRLRPAPQFYIPEAHFIEYDTRCEVSLGDYVTMEVTSKGRSNQFCSSPFAEVGRGNFSKFWHPDGTGAGDNTSFVGISSRGLAFGDQTAKWNGYFVSPVTLACTLGSDASDAERTAWARQWKAYQNQDYCNRIP